MQIFNCPTCATPVYFHNHSCNCGQALMFDPAGQAMVPLDKGCTNRARIGCNWAASGGLCVSCAMTRTVPDLDEGENRELWAETERAKRWMLANLMRWGWFTIDDPGMRPRFRLLSDQTASGDAQVIMGHAAGVITIDVTEASPATRVRRRENLGELYRTMLGHMRHETAHFLFVRLSRDPVFLDAFRGLFGDERQDYAAALEAHYAAPRDPGQAHVTPYATSHPHEDWAETIAHLLHLVDLLDSAAAAGVAGVMTPGYDAYADRDTETLIRRALDISMAVTHVNRALGLPDLYPFVLSEAVIGKMAFAHAAILGREGNNV